MLSNILVRRRIHQYLSSSYQHARLDDPVVVALASRGVRFAEIASDQSDLLKQKSLGPNLTGQNQSGHPGLQSVAGADLVFVVSAGSAAIW